MTEFPRQAHGNCIADDQQAVVYRETRPPQIPQIVLNLGTAGQFVWEEFFSGYLRNRHTRAAYLHAVQRFLRWVEPLEPDIARITPGILGRYFDDLPVSVPTKKLHLSALRRFFDMLVQRHAILLNPALSVRTERYSAIEGKTPEIRTAQVRQLLAAIGTRTAADFRDKAIIATLIYTAARVGAVAKLKQRDYVFDGQQYVLKFQEKGGKARIIPVRHDLQQFIGDYLDMLSTPADAPLFRSLTRERTLSSRGLSGVDICRIVKRRLKSANLPTLASPHSFRACTATDLLTQGVPIEDVQYLLGHSDVRITRLYDRRQRQVTRNIVERISL